jgi:glycosyltransferase involved in cell wall biosynthesis
MRHELGLKDQFLWFAAGRLEPVKDFSTLLWAFAQVQETARLVIAGSGPLLNELSHLATRLNLADRVHFLGHETDVRRWMQAADGFVLSSQREGLSMSLLEAAACGLPAVATGVPGNREVIVDGQTGILTQAVGSALALEGAMTRLMRASKEERRAMGEQARQLAIERFSLEAVLDRWESLYRDNLEQNPKPRRWGQTI